MQTANHILYVINFVNCYMFGCCVYVCMRMRQKQTNLSPKQLIDLVRVRSENAGNRRAIRNNADQRCQNITRYANVTRSEITRYANVTRIEITRYANVTRSEITCYANVTRSEITCNAM